MSTLTPQQIATVCRNAGFTGSDLVMAIAVVLRESGGNTDATNHNTNGTTDYGLFQINTVNAQVLQTGNWANPNDNARMAYTLFRQSGWRPWNSSNNRLSLFLNTAKQAAGMPDATVPAAGSTTTDATVISRNSVDSFGSTVQFITDPHNWYRIGMFIAGGAVFMVGAMAYAKGTPLGQAVVDTAGKVGEVAAVAA